MKSLRVLSMVFLLALGFIAIRPIASYAENMKNDSKAEVAISGFCPVCVIHGGMANKGSDNFVTEYKGKVYKFVDFDKQKTFIEDPETFTKDLEAKFQQIKM